MVFRGNNIKSKINMISIATCRAFFCTISLHSNGRPLNLAKRLISLFFFGFSPFACCGSVSFAHALVRFGWFDFSVCCCCWNEEGNDFGARATTVGSPEWQPRLQDNQSNWVMVFVEFVIRRIIPLGQHFHDLGLVSRVMVVLAVGRDLVPLPVYHAPLSSIDTNI